jgi:hypothetical protein
LWGFGGNLLVTKVIDVDIEGGEPIGELAGFRLDLAGGLVGDFAGGWQAENRREATSDR